MAEIWIIKRGTELVLTIEAKKSEEGRPIESFCRPGQTIKATVRWDTGYRMPRLEVRRQL